jgi:MFS family permease
MNIFKNRNFVLHWLCVIVAATGSFFSVVALPWLVLSVSNNDPVKMSGIVALSGLPYAVLILFGGALTDRISPLRLLFVTRTCYVFLLLALAGLVYYQITPYWLLALFALVMGTLGAFGGPASESLLPSILPNEILGHGNGIIMVTMQVTQILGPMLAGWVLWFGRTLNGIPVNQIDYTSISWAFGLNAIAIGIVVCVMTQIRVQPGKSTAPKGNLFQMIWDGILFCWKDHGIRTILMYLTLISFFIHGPLGAILPILSKVKLGLSEAQFGSMYAMLGLGSILGAGLAVVLKPNPRKLGRWILCCDCVSGCAMLTLGQSNTIVINYGLLLLIGSMGGLIALTGVTWLQQRTPDQLMGRIMSILMFTIMGLIPVSAAVTGYLIQLTTLSSVMTGSGIIIIICTVTGLLIPSIRRMGKQTPLRSIRQDG